MFQLLLITINFAVKLSNNKFNHEKINNHFGGVRDGDCRRCTTSKRQRG